MGFDTYGPSKPPRPVQAPTVESTVGGIDARLRQHDRKLDTRRKVSGSPVHGSSGAQTFDLTAPDADGFDVTLPGDDTLAWQVALTVRSDMPVTCWAATVLAGVVGQGVAGLDGTTVAAPTQHAVFHGGDTFTCAAAVTGTGDAHVVVEFSAIRLS